MKRISLDELIKNNPEAENSDYEQQYNYVKNLINSGKVKILKASGTNGKKPALYREYWIVEEEKDNSELIEELKYKLIPSINIDYYLKHIKEYEKDRQWVLMLNNYIKNNNDRLKQQMSVNERSFDIWQHEKFITKESGIKILNRCKIPTALLNMYNTAEPITYYTCEKACPQNIIIIENKDTFYSMRRKMLAGSKSIIGLQTGTLIYGAGKGILSSFKEFDICTEPYISSVQNTLYYFGDMDYEGIGIYENLAEIGNKTGGYNIIPFVSAYKAMLKKAINTDMLPETKEKQNKNIKGIFLSYFDSSDADDMMNILKSGKYIPQEILNIADF